VHPTGGTRRVFKQVAWLEAGSGKAALPRPAHPRVTQAVGQVIDSTIKGGMKTWKHKHHLVPQVLPN